MIVQVVSWFSWLREPIQLLDLSCTSFNGTAFIWTPAATGCSNVISDSSCAVLYPAPVPADGYLSSGKDQQRPLACYTTATATPAAVIRDCSSEFVPEKMRIVLSDFCLQLPKCCFPTSQLCFHHILPMPVASLENNHCYGLPICLRILQLRGIRERRSRLRQ